MADLVAGLLGRYDVDPSFGLLSSVRTALRLPSHFSIIDEILDSLPSLNVKKKVRQVISKIPVMDFSPMTSESELKRAMLAFSFIGHSYVWEGDNGVARLPEQIAIPWFEISKKVGRPPVLSYASYILDNAKVDAFGVLESLNESLSPISTFSGGTDEIWFIVVHQQIEVEASKLVASVLLCIDQCQSDSMEELCETLLSLDVSLAMINGVLRTMRVGCDPYVYFRNVRKFLHGWRSDGAFSSGGLVYGGVERLGSGGVIFAGESGAQSAIVPLLDAVLDIEHLGALAHFVNSMPAYMPPRHRALLSYARKGPKRVRALLKEHGSNLSLQRYNALLERVAEFRLEHIGLARDYISKQQGSTLGNPTGIGTGGTPLEEYLGKHIEDTYKAHILS